MWRNLIPAWLPSRLNADMLALQGVAERARCAWACPFSSSEEFEAAVIQARRQAGAYGRKRHWRYALYAGAASSVLGALIWMV